MELKVILPFPMAALSPNNARKFHWTKIRKAKAQYREWAGYAGLEAKQKAPHVPTPMTAATMEIHFYYPRLSWDRDNILAALKPGCDGLVDAKILVDDDNLIPLPAKRYHDKVNPRVELIIKPYEGEFDQVFR